MTAPNSHQIAWISLLPQTAVMALFVTAYYRLGIDVYVMAGCGTYFVLFKALQYFIAWDHRLGISLIRSGAFRSAIGHFEKSYRFFSKHRRLDDYRYLLILNSSKISYRELALHYIAYCYDQLGDTQQTTATCKRMLGEFPDNRLTGCTLAK